MSAAKHWTWTLHIDGNTPAPEYKPDAMEYMCYQRERCPTTGREHYQGYVCFSRKQRLNGAKRHLGANTAHMEISRGSPSQNREYCSKPDTAIAGSFMEYGVLPEGMGKRSDLKKFVEALEADVNLDVYREYPEIVAKYPRFVTSIRARIMEREAGLLSVELPDSDWSRELSEELSGVPSAREVIWIVGRTGGEGKSTFCRGYKSDGERHGYVVTGGQHADIYYAYDYEPVVFFDWPRDKQDSFPYAVVENFKNGYFLSTKYEVRKVRFRTPHVVVFANFFPDLDKLSADRWKIKEIN